MESVLLAGRPTSRLGFGGSTLGSLSRRDAMRVLSAAYDAGIRHFDVAPLYAFGRSERLLRDALGGNLQHVTVTTKYGLTPPAHSAWIGPVHRVARTMLSALPAVRKRLRANVASPHGNDPPLTAAAAEASIAASLHHLGVDSIDLLLLHEATPERLADPRLMDLLEKEKTFGRLRQFGVGSRRDRVLACLEQRPDFCRMVQFEWSVFSSPCAELDRRERIVHGSLNAPLQTFQEWLFGDSKRCDRWCSDTNADLRVPGMIARLLLKASLVHNAGTIVLFSTRNPTRIQDNIATAEDESLRGAASTFYSLVQQEYHPAMAAEPHPAEGAR